MITRLPKKFREATLSSLDVEQFPMILTYAKEWRSRLSRGKGLLLAGPPGVGKTWALAALTKHFVESVGKVTPNTRLADYEFVTAPQFFENLGFDHEEDDYREQSWFTTYTTVPWLVINDLGKEYRSGKLVDQVRYQLGRVLRERNESNKSVHVTTNLAIKDIENTYGESICSLLSDMATLHVVLGADRRITSA